MIQLLITTTLFAFFMATIFYVRTRRAQTRHKSPVMTCHERSQCCSNSGSCTKKE